VKTISFIAGYFLDIFLYKILLGSMMIFMQACIEVVAMLGMVMPMAYIYVIASHYEPYKRGFFCDDQNLKHPYR
jgi:hypothetical protein